MTRKIEDISTDHPGVRFPPPLIYAIPLAAGTMLDFAYGRSLGLNDVVRNGAAILLMVAAAIVLTLALNLFRIAQTRPEPWQPTTTIVESGIYALSRNPMYLGMALAYAAVALFCDSPTALLLLPIVLLIIHFAVIRREERYLEAKFGANYSRYKNRVRRWL